MLQAQGKLREASAHFARALTLMPQLFDAFDSVCATLVAVLPALHEAMRRAAAAWPEQLPAHELFDGAGIAQIMDDPLLLCILQSTPVREFSLERVLTLVRSALLADAATEKTSDDKTLAFCCALAKQCFINEYVFATTPEEDALAERLKTALGACDRVRHSHCPDQARRPRDVPSAARYPRCAASCSRKTGRRRSMPS